MLLHRCCPVDKDAVTRLQISSTPLRLKPAAPDYQLQNENIRRIECGQTPLMRWESCGESLLGADRSETMML